jgi:hypothetical protein
MLALAADTAGHRTLDGMALWRRLLAELLGSAFLRALVIGPGMAAQRLSPSATPAHV